MDRTGSGSCLAAGCDMIGVVLYYTQLIGKMDCREIVREDGSWVELAEYRVQWRCLTL